MHFPYIFGATFLYRGSQLSIQSHWYLHGHGSIHHCGKTSSNHCGIVWEWHRRFGASYATLWEIRRLFQGMLFPSMAIFKSIYLYWVLQGEESNSSANKCMLKVAQYAAQLENYERAITIYEQVAASALESSLIKYSAKEYFFRAALCHLCVDVVNAQHAVTRYEEQFPAFCDSREVKLVKVRICNLLSLQTSL